MKPKTIFEGKDREQARGKVRWHAARLEGKVKNLGIKKELKQKAV